MNRLIVAATELEIRPFLEKHPEAEVLITGIGSVATAYQLTKALSKKSYDWVINAGIAGTFNENIPIGEVVEVVSDEFADLGIETSTAFQTLFEANFLDKNTFPFQDGKLIPSQPQSGDTLRQVTAITVNTTHGNDLSIHELKKKFRVDIESMEGAAFFYVCLMEGVKCSQIRSISNRVESRNKDLWNIPLAVKNLNEALNNLLSTTF
jgi:futalosine hydrolase